MSPSSSDLAVQDAVSSDASAYFSWTFLPSSYCACHTLEFLISRVRPKCPYYGGDSTYVHTVKADSVFLRMQQNWYVSSH